MKKSKLDTETTKSEVEHVARIEHVVWRVPPLPIYRLMYAAEIAFRYYPDLRQDIEKALGPALTIVDDTFRSLPKDNSPITYFLNFYERLFQFADIQCQKDLRQEYLEAQSK